MSFFARASCGIALLAVGLGGYRPAFCATSHSIAGVALQQEIRDALVRDLRLDPLQPAASHLQILRPASAFQAGTRLRVVAITKAQAQPGWMVRMDCERRQDCLPFYVLLAADAIALEGKSPPAVRKTLAITASQAAGAEAPLKKMGDRVRLIEEISGLHLQTVAVCLQPGRPGETIRVRNLSTKRVIMAKLLKGDVARVER